MFDKKGQGALEYLLLIGGAVLVAVIVISMLLSSVGTTTTSTQAQLALQQLKSQCDGNVAIFSITQSPPNNLNKCTGSAVPARNCNQFGIKDSLGTTITGCAGS